MAARRALLRVTGRPARSRLFRSLRRVAATSTRGRSFGLVRRQATNLANRLVPVGQTFAAPKRIQPLEQTAFEREKSSVGIMLLHHLFPDRDRQAVGALLVPGDLLDLQVALVVLVENRPAKEEEKRHFTALERVEIFRRRDVQIEGARDRQDRFRLLGKLPHVDVGVRPQTSAQSLAPAIRRAEEFAQLFFLVRLIRTQSRMDLDLRLQHHALDRFLRGLVGDLELEMQ